jgi:tripartite-type tricarboxylate transporter receptor subunit TctC
VTPSAIPTDALQRLSKALEWALLQDDVQSKLAALGAEPGSGQASELQMLMRQDALKWGRVIKESGVKFE